MEDQKSIDDVVHTTAPQASTLEDQTPFQPRIRHITSIQVRNLTPFPARDTLASALNQRSGPSQFASLGHFSDDADIALSRRRTRRISTTSVNTLRSIHSEGLHDEVLTNYDTSQSPKTRKRTSSKASIQSGPSVSTGSPSMRRQPNTISSGTTPSIRPVRPRTTSHVSITEPQGLFAPPPTASSSQASTSASAILNASPDHNSQKGLEKVIWSRLVETFITLSAPPQDTETLSPSDSPPSTLHPQRDKTVHKKGATNSSPSDRRNGLGLTGVPHQGSAGTPTLKAPPTLKRDGPSHVLSTPRDRESRSTKSKVTSSSRAGSNHSPTSASPRKMAFPQSPPLTPPLPLSPNEPQTPIYISPFHRPSTNPTFTFDAKDHEFAEGADLTAGRLIITVWSRAGPRWSSGDTKGKAKEVIDDVPGEGRDEWKALHTWDVDLSELAPLPEELHSHPSRLPSNSLLLTLSPTGKTYYLPSRLGNHSPQPSRSPSPECNSDPETASSRVRQSGRAALLKHVRAEHGLEERGRDRWSRSKEVRSAGWQDLVKLVTLQACIIDTQDSLREILCNCDSALEKDNVTIMRREISEREYRVRTILEHRDTVRDHSFEAQHQLEARRERLRERQQNLAEARAMHEDNLLSEFDNGSKIAEERKRHMLLVNQLPPIRTLLLSTLSFIFPIELLSPPDLLFTILSVPLPIPLTVSDPGPPLTLASHSEVTEDSVATALGYAAQVVQLMAVYLGQGLVYPITYCGSRSLIKDPISSMMGPRMFPLYSKGVDTYRFEYAVFLLNKDIEMLMADRNLRALDIRHTLPNLKNLLLTLTDGDGSHVNRGIRSTDSLTIPPGLQSPTLMPTTPSFISSSSSELPSSTSLESTGTTVAEASALSAMAAFNRRRKSYLGFSPLTSIFRARYPTSAGKPSVQTTEVAPEGGGEEDDEDSATNSPPLTAGHSQSDDDDDRRTIRGVPVAEDVHDKALNGSGRTALKEAEKEVKEPPPAALAPSVPHLT